MDHEAEVFKGTRPKYVPPKRPPKKKPSPSTDPSHESSMDSSTSSTPLPLPEESDSISIRIVMIDPNDFVSTLYSNGLSKKFAQFQKKNPHTQRYALKIASYIDYQEALHLLSSSPIDLLMIEYKSDDYQIMDVLQALKAQGVNLNRV